MWELTREQEAAVEVLAGNHPSVHVKGGFADGLVRATVPNGIEFFINENGAIVKSGLNFSVNWKDDPVWGRELGRGLAPEDDAMDWGEWVEIAPGKWERVA